MKDFKSRFCTIARRFQRFYCLSVEAKVRQLSAYTKLLVIFNISNNATASYYRYRRCTQG